MAKFIHLQNSFSSGEFGDRLLGRADSADYNNACKEILNFLPIKQGGLTRRMGSKFVALGIGKPAIIPFIFSKSEGYAILLPHAGFEQPVVIDKNGVSQNVEITDVVMYPTRSLKLFTAMVNDLSLDIDGWHHVQSGDIVIIVHNSGLVPPFTIKRTNDPSIKFTFEWYSFPGISVSFTDSTKFFDQNIVLRHPFENINIDDNKWISFNNPTVQFSGLVAHTLTAYNTQAKTTALKNFWKKNEIGSIFRVVPYITAAPLPKPSNVEYSFLIVDLSDDSNPNYPNESSEAVGILLTPAGSGLTSDPSFVTKDWKRSSWSEQSGWPKSIASYQSRLFFGGNKDYPDTLWSSLTSDIFHMMKERFEQDKNIVDKENDVTRFDYFGVESDSDPLALIPSSNEVNKIQWIHGGAALVIGTIGGEFILVGQDSGLSSSSATLVKQSSVGSSDVMSAAVSNTMFFVSRSGRKLYDISVDASNLASKARDLNILNEDIIKHNSSDLQQITKVVGQSSTNTVWAKTSANQLIGFTVEESSKVSAWHRHTLGGENTNIISVGVIPNESGSFDDLWIVVEKEGLGVSLNNTVAFSGSDVVDNGTGFTFIDEPEVENFPRRFVLKIPSSTVGLDLDGDYFTIDDGDLWNVWFNSSPTLGGAAPDIAETFDIKVDVDDTDDADTVLSKIHTTLNSRRRIVCAKSNYRVIAIPATPAGIHEHFTITETLGETGHLNYEIRINPLALESPSALAGGIIANQEYFYISIGFKTYKIYFGVIDGPAGPDGDFNVPILAGDTETQIIETIQTTIDSILFGGKPDFTTNTELFLIKAVIGYQTIERIGENFSNDSLLNTSTNEADKPYYMDSSIRSTTFSSPLVVTGFDHLKGDIVQVLADGFYVGNKLVADDGSITLDAVATEVIAGYGYTARFKTLPIEVGGDYGSSIGTIQRIDKVTALLYKTYGAKVGYEEDKLEDMELLANDYVMGDPLPLFTGRKEVYFPASPDDEQYVIIEQTKPYPVTVVALAIRGKTYDRSE